MRWFLLPCLLLCACRIETAAPRAQEAAPASLTPTGTVWIYSSMYRHVIDALEPELKRQLPQVNVQWFQAGSEKVTARLEAELGAGGSQADLLAVSDPLLYARLKHEGRLLPFASVNALRTPRSLVDLDGTATTLRLSTMVLVHRQGTPAPTSFAALLEPALKGEVVLGDPLTSGTALSWALTQRAVLGDEVFTRLRANGARVGGGNAAVLQRLEGGEASVGVVLHENAVASRRRGSPIAIAWPTDGAVVIPGQLAILKGSRNPVAARAVADALLSPACQKLIVSTGDMYAADPRLPPPEDAPPLEELLKTARLPPISDEDAQSGAAGLKQRFTEAFSK